MSVGVDLLSLDRHLYSNPLRLAVHDNFHVVLILGHFPGNLLRLGGHVLGDGDDGAAVKDCHHQLSASDCLIPRTMDLQPPR